MDHPTLSVGQDMAGKRVVVTGGTRGIGAAIVARMVSGGATVVAVARHRAPDLPAGVEVVTGDLTSEAGVTTVAERCLALLGGADVLVNNAGGFTLHTSGVVAIPDGDWLQALELNFLSAVRMDRALLPALGEARGAIVEVSSQAGHTPAHQTLPYGAAKAALTTYAKGLSRAVADLGVRVNTVAPGTIATGPIDEMVDAIAEMTGVDAEAAMAQIVEDIPLGGPGSPHHVAELVAFLASERAAWITGATFVVDGGAVRTLL